jgi:hypothetical protein
MTIGDLRVQLETVLAIGESRTVLIQGSGPPLVSCTVPAGDFKCSSSGTGALAAGDVYSLVIQNGFGGASSTAVSVGYTLKAQ